MKTATIHKTSSQLASKEGKASKNTLKSTANAADLMPTDINPVTPLPSNMMRIILNSWHPVCVNEDNIEVIGSFEI